MRQTIIFIGLALTVLYSYLSQRSSHVNPPKPKPWEIAFEQPFEAAHPFHDGLAAIETGGKYGYIDKTGRVVIEPQFDDAEDFSGGMARVTVDYKVGYINQRGEIVIKPQFEYAYDFSDGLALVSSDKRSASYIDNTGKVVIKTRSRYVTEFSEGLAAVSGQRLTDSYNYIDPTGKIIIRTPFSAAQPFYEGLSRVLIEPESKSNRGYGFIDRTGQVVIGPQFDAVGDRFSDGLAKVLVKNKWGYIDKTGKIVIAPNYEEADDFSEGLARVKFAGVYGFIGKDGRSVVNPRFTIASPFSEGLASVLDRGKFGYIDRDGNFFIEPEFEAADSFSEGVALVLLNGKPVYIRLVAASTSQKPTPTDKQNDKLRKQIEQIAAEAKGRVGVAAEVLETGESVSLNPHDHFPMQSVYKLPIAMAVLAQVDTGKLNLEQKERVDKSDFVRLGQASPVRDRYPNGVELTLSELLRFTVSESDGTTSDVLLDLVGVEGVSKYLNELGINEIIVANSEKEIGKDRETQYRNWASPQAAVQLLRSLHERRGLSEQSQQLLFKHMTETPTSAKRLKGLLPKTVVVAHKTGTGGSNDGVAPATNDIGLITLPDGRHLAIAVFVSDARTDLVTREGTIARIAKAIYDHFTQK
jgi:beta-lactamase class A